MTADDARPAPVSLRVLDNASAILVGYNLGSDIAAFVASLSTSAVVIVTDSNIESLHLRRLLAALKDTASQLKVLTYVLPPGELAKSRESKASIEDYMFANGCTRDTVMIALGGGVVGDLIGYVAATYMRGIRFLQVPTSLLAMVDSSVGGKTAIDVPAGKNLVGAFWQPARIFVDMAYLTTLPEREFINGMAEVIKTAAIWSEADFEFLEANVEHVAQIMERARTTRTLSAKDQAIVQSVVLGSIRVKAHVVTSDERETGLRGLLNFGHTIGHAIEAIHAPLLLHGECVSVGMILEAEVAHHLGILSDIAVRRLARCCSSYGLPVALEESLVRQRTNGASCKVEAMMDYMKVDKKNTGAVKRMVLLKRIGETHEPRASAVADNVIRLIIAPAVAVHGGKSSPTAPEPVTVKVPGSKSISNRALILAALGQGTCRIKNLLHSDDTKYMLAALQQLQACRVTWEDDGETLVIHGNGGRLLPSDKPLYLGNAGTAARFLTTVAALVPDAGTSAATVLTGNARMKQRPIGALVDALQANGCAISCQETQGCLPLRVLPSGGLPGGLIELAASVSSQYVSSILLAAPYAKQSVTLKLVGGHVVSQPYIDMTLAMMRSFGVVVQRVDETTYKIPQTVYTNPTVYAVEPDASSATYPLAVAAITGASVVIPHIGRNSLQGDAQFAAQVIGAMGGQVEQTDSETRVTGPPPGQLRALPAIDMEPMTDAFLTASVLAAVAQGETTITGIANQRVKECNRIAAMVAELGKFGVQAHELPDGIVITGRPAAELVPPADGVVCYDDHRVAMAFSVLSAALPHGQSAVMREKRCVEKTWPTWWSTLINTLGVAVTGVDIEHAEPTSTRAVVQQAKPLKSATIVLIGMRGAGKTHLGRAAGQALQRPVVDLDQVFEEQQGMAISEFVAKAGWEAFRSMEASLLDQVLQGEHAQGAVVVCGGGVVETPAAQTTLERASRNRTAIVVHVRRPIGDVLAYLAQDRQRPTWSEDMASVWERRQPLYHRLSQYEFFCLPARDGDWEPVNRDFARFLHFVLRGDRFAFPAPTPSATASGVSSFLSLTSPDIADLLPVLATASAGASALELRVDLLQLRSVDDVRHQLFLLRRHTTLPVIFTVRSVDQGGRFPDQDADAMFELLHWAVKWGVEVVDMEITHPLQHMDGLKQALQHTPSLLLASYHDRQGQYGWRHPTMMQHLVTANRYGDIVKLISLATSMSDNYALQEFIKRIARPLLGEKARSLIALNMGTCGQLSRVLNDFLVPVTHAALPFPAAPGQLSLSDIHSARHFLGMLPARQFYLFGSPISQSMSPTLHNTGFRALGLPYKYALLETAQVDDALVTTVRAPDFGGASVTIPHKLDAMRQLVDRATDAAARIGAINTIYIDAQPGQKPVLVGDNTDYQGILAAIRKRPAPTHRDAVVVGAGGTARAAIFALQTWARDGATIYIWNRTFAAAERLAAELHVPNSSVRLVAVQSADQIPATIGVIVATIPASAQEHMVGAAARLLDTFPVVVDMAYRPRQTPLLQLYSQHLAAAATPAPDVRQVQAQGIEVLIEQGLRQFYLWTGSVPPRSIMEQAVEQHYQEV